MADYVITDGEFTVRVSDSLDRWIDEQYAAAARAVAASFEEVLQPVADHARAEWYGPRGVKRDTGASGDIRVVTTIDVGRHTVTTAVGSTDTKMVKGRDGRARPRATAIHRPGALAMEWVQVTDSEYWRMWRENDKLGRRVNAVKHDRKTGLYYAKKLKPTNADGAYLLPLLITGPARKAIKGLNRALGRRLALSGAMGA